MLQIPLVPPGGLEHVQQGHLPDGPGAAQAGDQEGHREKQQGEAHRVGVEGEGQVKGLPIRCQEQGADELGQDDPQQDPQPQGQQAHAPALRQEEQGHGAGLHPKHPLDGQGGLLLPEQEAVDIPDEKPQQQGHPADGHLHPVAEAGEVKGCPDVRVIVGTGNGEKGVKQPHAQGKGDQIDQIVARRSPGGAEDEFSVHPSSLLPAW